MSKFLNIVLAIALLLLIDTGVRQLWAQPTGGGAASSVSIIGSALTYLSDMATDIALMEADIDNLANNIATDAGEDDPVTDLKDGPQVLSVRRDSAISSAGTDADYATFNTDYLGRLWVRNGDPCADHARISNAPVNGSINGNSEIVALSGSTLIYVCGYDLTIGGTANVRLVYGTGTACATGETTVTGLWPAIAQWGIVRPVTGSTQHRIPSGNALCIETSGAVTVGGSVQYVQVASTSA